MKLDFWRVLCPDFALKNTIGYILRENALQVLMYILGAALFDLTWWPLALIYLVIAEEDAGQGRMILENVNYGD